MENLKMNAISDDELSGVAGGYLEVSKWRDFVSTSVLPTLNGLKGMGTPGDNAIVDQIITSLRGTLVPGASIDSPVRALYNSVRGELSRQISSQQVRSGLENALGNAVSYLNRNG